MEWPFDYTAVRYLLLIAGIDVAACHPSILAPSPPCNQDGTIVHHKARHELPEDHDDDTSQLPSAFHSSLLALSMSVLGEELHHTPQQAEEAPPPPQRAGHVHVPYQDMYDSETALLGPRQPTESPCISTCASWMRSLLRCCYCPRGTNCYPIMQPVYTVILTTCCVLQLMVSFKTYNRVQQSVASAIYLVWTALGLMLVSVIAPYSLAVVTKFLQKGEFSYLFSVACRCTQHTARTHGMSPPAWVTHRLYKRIKWPTVCMAIAFLVGTAGTILLMMVSVRQRTGADRIPRSDRQIIAWTSIGSLFGSFIQVSALWVFFLGCALLEIIHTSRAFHTTRLRQTGSAASDGEDDDDDDESLPQLHSRPQSGVRRRRRRRRAADDEDEPQAATVDGQYMLTHLLLREQHVALSRRWQGLVSVTVLASLLFVAFMLTWTYTSEFTTYLLNVPEVQLVGIYAVICCLVLSVPALIFYSLSFVNNCQDQVLKAIIASPTWSLEQRDALHFLVAHAPCTVDLYSVTLTTSRVRKIVFSGIIALVPSLIRAGINS